MKEKIKIAIAFIISIIVSGVISAYAATIIDASNVSYTSNSQSTVEGALNNLYTTANNYARQLTASKGDIKLIELSKSATVPANSTYTSIEMGTYSCGTGYTYVGVYPRNNGYGDQWVVSYAPYPANITKIHADVSSKYSSSLTNNLKCVVVCVKNNVYNNAVIMSGY